MNDDFFEGTNLHENKPEPQENAFSAPDSTSYNPYTARPSTVQPAEKTVVQPEQEPAVQPAVQPAVPHEEKPVYAETFAEMYRPTDSSTYRTVEPITAPASAPTAQADAPSADGYYYRSFTKHEEPVRREAPRREQKQKTSGMGKGAVAALIIVCILISGAAGFGGSILASKLNLTGNNNDDTSENAVVETTSDDGTGTASAVNTGPDKTTADITEIAAPAVVEITTEIVQTSEFYGQYIVQGAGSGVIINENGTIITNNHVIEDAKDITVTLRTGESFDGQVIGTDEELDVALVKIEPGDTKLTVAKMGDSDTLKVGDKSVIIGNPLGTLGGSVTEGIISALDRSIVIDDKTMTLMQTDAAINAGNSGGGMFNGQGELVGIVVAKNYSGEVDNIGFVIPINAAKTILEDLEDYGYVRGKADTGMTFVDISNALYAYYYFESASPGVYINSVEQGSNADQAGFQVGDRVVSIDEKGIDDVADIKKYISGKSVGDEVEFTIERAGRTVTLNLKLEEKIPESAKN